MDRQLAALAAEHGVATSYEDSRHERVAVSAETVVSVLGLLDVDATTPDRIAAALASTRVVGQRASPSADHRAAPWHRPSVAGARRGDDRRRPNGIDVGDALPDDLPLGWHRLACGEQDVTLVVVPRRLPAAAPTWGWMLQLYALHSADSWGMGDLADLASLTRWAGGRGPAAQSPANASTPRTAGDARAGLILLNPLHAVGPTHPVPASPYSPTSRRFANPLYLSVTETAAFRGSGRGPRRSGGRAASAGVGRRPDLIDYDAVWSAKLAALELLFPLAGSIDLGADPDVTSFATYCALAERHGSDWRTWPRRAARSASADSVRDGARRTGRPGRVFRVAATAVRRAVGDRRDRRARDRHARRDRARPCRRRRPGRRGRLDARGCVGHGRPRRCATGCVQSTRPGLGSGRVAPGPAGRDGLRGLPRPASSGIEPCRRPTRRPCGRSVPVVVDPAGRGRYRRHVRPLRRGRDARHPRARGGARRRGRDRRGPRHRTAGGVAGSTVAEHARVHGRVVRARLGPARQSVPPARPVAA